MNQINPTFKIDAPWNTKHDDVASRLFCYNSHHGSQVMVFSLPRSSVNNPRNPLGGIDNDMHQAWSNPWGQSSEMLQGLHNNKVWLDAFYLMDRVVPTAEVDRFHIHERLDSFKVWSHVEPQADQDHYGLDVKETRVWAYVKEAIADDGFPEPLSYVWQAAKTLWRDMVETFAGYIDVYPTEDGEIVLDATVSEGKKSWVILECGPSETVLCIVNMEGEFRYQELSGTDYRDNTFISEAVAELQGKCTGRYESFRT